MSAEIAGNVPLKYRLPVEKFSPALKEVTGSVEPAFTIGDVPYFDRLPTEPAKRPRQTLLPMSKVGDWVQDYIAANPDQGKSIGWIADESGIRNPRFGSVEHYATVEYDLEGNLTNFIADGILQQDGRLDTRTGIGTPGSLVAPIEKVGEDFYVHCFWQWRPAPWDQAVEVPAELTDPREIEDFKALNTGEWLLTVPGGFAKFAGESPEKVGERESMEEAGLKIDAPVFGRKSFNRGSNATMVGVGYSSFERVGDEIPEEGERLFGKMAVRIDTFRTGDGMVGAAVNHAREELGLIRSGK